MSHHRVFTLRRFADFPAIPVKMRECSEPNVIVIGIFRLYQRETADSHNFMVTGWVWGDLYHDLLQRKELGNLSPVTLSLCTQKQQITRCALLTKMKMHPKLFAV
jgi:hypothetical protein